MLQILTISEIKKIGAGYDSVAYLVNDEYIFKIKYSENMKKGYAKEKAIYDFLNKNLKYVCLFFRQNKMTLLL